MRLPPTNFTLRLLLDTTKTPMQSKFDYLSFPSKLQYLFRSPFGSFGAFGKMIDLAGYGSSVGPYSLVSGAAPIKAPHLGSVLWLYAKNQSGWNDVFYLVDSPRQMCHRDRGRNVVCDSFPNDFTWEPVGGSGAPTGWWSTGSFRVFCPTGFSQFIDSCLKLPGLPSPGLTAEPYDTATCATADASGRVITEILVVVSYFLYEGLKALASTEASGKSFWVGKWPEVEGGPLDLPHLWQAGGRAAVADCVLADKAQGFLLKRVACTEAATTFCKARPPSCPPGYTWLPDGGKSSCFRLADNTMFITPNTDYVASASISTAHKVCKDDDTRLATPRTTAEIDALKKFVQIQDVQVTGRADSERQMKVWLGLQYFRQSQTQPSPADCQSCQTSPLWADGFISPWSKYLIPKANLTTTLGAAFSESRQCFVIKRNAAGSTILLKHECYATLDTRTDNGYHALCEYRACPLCVFPFKLGGRLYDTCTTVGSTDGAAWCSTELDESGNHVDGNAVPCPADCPVSDCPVGFMPHLKTCIQESASILADAPTNVTEAERRCTVQGGRLYQPRSKRTFDALKVKNPTFYNAAHPTRVGILDWASVDYDQQTAFGVTMKSANSSSDMLYRDGSPFPGGLMPGSFSWTAGYPHTDGNKSCVTIMDQEELGNNDCEGFSVGSSATYLAYICEARPFTTKKFSPNPGRSCHFPFRLEAGGDWHHSCMYEKKDNGNNYVWCPTSVDEDGVMIKEEVGECIDERNTVYAGPGDLVV
jgi:hypothetical protein